MTLAEHQRHLFSYPALFARHLAGDDMDAFNVCLAEYARHLDFNWDELVAWVRHLMPMILADDYEAFHAPALLQRDGLLAAMSSYVLNWQTCCPKSHRAECNEGLIISLAGICCEDTSECWVGAEAGFKSIYYSYASELIPRELDDELHGIAHEALLTRRFWAILDPVVFLLAVHLKGGQPCSLEADLDEWYRLHKEEVTEFMNRSDEAPEYYLQELRADMSSKQLFSSSSWGETIGEGALRDRLCSELQKLPDTIERWGKNA